jgi:hypothetical protein
MFPIKNILKKGDAFSSLLLNFAVEYAIRKDEANQQGLEVNIMHQILVYDDGVKILGGSTHTIQKNTEMVVANEKIGLGVNAEETKYIVMSRDQHTGQNHNIYVGNKSLERVQQFRYLRKFSQFKIPFMKKLRADRSQGMLVSSRCRIFAFQFAIQIQTVKI